MGGGQCHTLTKILSFFDKDQE
jgi:uncharacterized protein YdaU (DUF1376 family)